MARVPTGSGEALDEPLRILVADGRRERLDEVARTVVSLGHGVVGEASLADVATMTASLRPDAAIVMSARAPTMPLELIGKIVSEAACPVIAILDVEDEAFVQRAAKRGILAYTTKERDAVALQSSLDIVLSRFAESTASRGRSPAGP